MADAVTPNSLRSSMVRFGSTAPSTPVVAEHDLILAKAEASQPRPDVHRRFPALSAPQYQFFSESMSS